MENNQHVGSNAKQTLTREVVTLERVTKGWKPLSPRRAFFWELAVIETYTSLSNHTVNYLSPCSTRLLQNPSFPFYCHPSPSTVILPLFPSFLWHHIFHPSFPSTGWHPLPTQSPKDRSFQQLFMTKRPKEKLQDTRGGSSLPKATRSSQQPPRQSDAEQKHHK